MKMILKRRICLPYLALAIAVVAEEKPQESLRRRKESLRRPMAKLEEQKRRRQQAFFPIDFSFSGDESHLELGRQQREQMNDLKPGQDLSERIIGGRSASAGDYPFFVEWSRGCGGTLIHQDLVLSAAHCYNPASQQLTVWVGGVRTGRARQRSIAAAFVHPQYDPDTEAYDFVILKLDKEIRGAIQPVVLNTQPSNFRDPEDGEELTVIGYGVTDLVNQAQSQTLLAADVNYIEDCATRSNYELGVVQPTIMFCAGAPRGSHDSCQGDSGGPILDSNNRQIGIVSFGRGCADPTYPGVYARVSAVSKWIDQMKCLSTADQPRDCVMIRIDIQYDGYPLENSWKLLDADNNVIYRVKAGEIQRSGHIPTTLIVRAGSYSLEVQDKVGDGICCLYGEGFISVYTGDSWVEASGAFGRETSVDFTVNPSRDQSVREYARYGHSVSLRMIINYDSFPPETSWQLMNDDTGAPVDDLAPLSQTQPGTVTRDYHNLRAGHYWFSITDSADDGICCRSGWGYVLFQKISSAGDFLSNVTFISGEFGSYHEEDFLLT